MVVYLIHFDNLICEISMCLTISQSDSYMQLSILYRDRIKRKTVKHVSYSKYHIPLLYIKCFEHETAVYFLGDEEKASVLSLSLSVIARGLYS
jgi:hypothetical protein